MNRQFFGDIVYLFKYDLVRHVMKALPLYADTLPVLDSYTCGKS